ncbi:MAG: hypothetical protein WBG71_06760 [Leeuwenhoekiella sp.]
MKYFLVFLIMIFYSCGIIDDGEEVQSARYIIQNETGTALEITGDFQERTVRVENGEAFECSIIISRTQATALCGGFIEIKIVGTSKGYRCYGSTDQIEGLCFTEDFRLFTRFEGSVFTEIDTRVYQYIILPDLLENAFELPD